MLTAAESLLHELSLAQPDFTPHRFGLVAACDGGLIEVSGLSVPIGALCRVAHGPRTEFGGEPLAEVIGFRNGRTLMMLLGDTVMLRPGARVRPEGHPGMLPVGDAFLGRAVAMFSRAEDERTLRLHPEDIALVSDRLQADWKVVPDPTLARGALRVETTSGGVEDGPAEWRRALAEAFHAC